VWFNILLRYTVLKLRILDWCSGLEYVIFCLYYGGNSCVAAVAYLACEDVVLDGLVVYFHNIAVRRSEQFVYWPTILQKFHIWRETMSGSQINDKQTVDSSVTFDIMTTHSTHVKPVVIPQHCSMKVRAVCSLAYYFTITSTKCCKNKVVSSDDGHIGTWNM